MRRIRNAIVQQLGGSGRVSPVQSLLADRVAVLGLRLEMLDMDPAALMDERIGRQYVCYSNAYCRLLGQLGIEAPPAANAIPSLADHLARRAREAAAA